ncbi:MAG: hypothetical protein ABIL01_17905 [Pseudomonadota bacterium]
MKQIPMSSPGSTGRPSITEAFVLNREAAAYWIARSSRATTVLIVATAFSNGSAASPLLGNHVVAGVAAEDPHGGAADDGLEIAEMRHGRTAFVADARWNVRTIGRGNRIGGCHEVGLAGREK